MNSLIPRPEVALINASDVPSLLLLIRPSWQAKDLINRVKRIIQVDPSSACQRLFNAAIHDLREKVFIAGIDIAKDAAKQNKLPPIERLEDIEEYSTSKLIDLAHYIGLYTRPEWRRLSRCYEIRRDLEHEDDEYEAGVEDCIYIFQTCINVVLSRDPIHILRVTEVRELIEQPSPAAPAISLCEEYEHAPQPRQEEILKFLVAIALDADKSDLVRQNAVAFLAHFSPLTQNPVKLKIAEFIQGKINKNNISRTIIRVAFVAGVLPYIKQSILKDFFESIYKSMEQVGYRWGAHASHGELLRQYKDVGALESTPPEIRVKILKWMILAYIGEAGGRTMYGNIRHVFYSNTAEPLIEDMLKQSSELIREDIRSLAEVRDVKRACDTQHIERRLQSLIDLVG